MKLSCFDSSLLKTKAYNYTNSIILNPMRIATSAAMAGLINASSKAISIGFAYLYSKSLSLTIDSYHKAKQDFPACAASNAARDSFLKGPDHLIKEYWSDKSISDLFSINYYFNLYKDLTNIPEKTPGVSEILKRAKYVCENNPTQAQVKERLVDIYDRLQKISTEEASKTFEADCNTQTPETCATTLLPTRWKECLELSGSITPPPEIGFFDNLRNNLKGFIDSNFLKPNADRACSAYSADVNYMLLGVYALTALTIANFVKETLLYSTKTLYQNYTHPKNAEKQDLEKRLATLEHLLAIQKPIHSINPELQQVKSPTTSNKSIEESLSDKENLKKIISILLLNPSNNEAG